MAKRINKNLVVGLTISLMFTTTAGAVWMLANLRDMDPEIYVEQAKEAEADGDFALAEKYYMRAYRAAGRTEAKYLVLAGNASMEADNAEIAVGRWSSAVMLEPNLRDAQEAIVEFRREQARIIMRPSYWEELRKQAARLISLDDASALAHNANGLSLIGLREQDSRNLKEGEDHLVRAIELAPDNAEFVADLGQFLTGEKRPEEAREAYLAYLERNPESADGMRFFADFVSREGTKEGIEEMKSTLDRALALHPDDPDLHLSMGRYWYFQGRRLVSKAGAEGTDKEGRTYNDLIALAREMTSRALELAPDEYNPYLGLAKLYKSQIPPDFERAMQVYEARLARPLKSRNGFRGSINRQYQFELYTQAVQTLLYMCVPNDPTNKEQNRNEELLAQARKYLALAVSEIGIENRSTHLLRGKILHLDGKSREAIQELELAKKGASSNDVELFLLLGDLYFRDGQLGVAYDSVKQAVSFRPDFVPAWILLSRISLSLDQPTNALEWADQALKLAPDNAQARLIRAQSLNSLGRIDEVPQELRLLISTDDVNRAKIQEALILDLQGDTEGSITLVEEVLAAAPAYPEAVRMALVRYQQSGEMDKARQIVDRALEVDPDNRTLKVLKIDLEVEDKDERERRILELIAGAKNPGNRALLFFNYFVSNKNLDKAVEYLDQAEEIDPDSGVIIERQYRLALARKDWDRAEKYAAKAGRINLDGANGEFLRGQLFLSKAQFRRAIEVLRSALNTYPSNSDGYVWLGLALQYSGREEEASEAYKSAIDYDPSNGLAHRGLAMLASSRVDEPALYRHLAECEKYLPKDPWVISQVQQKLEKENPAAGIERREEVRREFPESLENLLVLAYLYTKVGDNERAISTAEEVLKIKSNRETIWKVSQIYLQAGQEAVAESMLKKLVEDSKDGDSKAGAQLLLAQHFERRAKTAEEMAVAEQAYLKAATYADSWQVCFQVARWYHQNGIRENNPEQFAKSIEWYRRAREKTDGELEKGSLWRYEIDAMFASRDFEMASQSIDQYVAAFPNDDRSLLYKGEIAMQFGQFDEALDVLDRYLEKESDSAVGYFRRGILHYARSDWNKAIADLTQAKALKPDGFQLTHRRRLSSALEARGNLQGAIAELQSVLDELDEEKLVEPEAIKIAKALADLYGRNQMLVEQEALALRFKNIMPDDPDWFTILGQNAILSGNFYKASEHLSEACKLSNYDEIPVDSAMIAWNSAGQYDKAIEFMTNTVPEERRGARAHLRWAQALASTKRVDESLEHFSVAIEMSRESAELSSAIAVVMIRSLGIQKSLEFAREQYNTDSSIRLNRVMLAALLQQTPDGLTEARDLWEVVLQDSTEDNQIVLPVTSLATLTYALKDFEGARKYYEQLLTYYRKLDEESSGVDVKGFIAGVLNNLAYLLADDLNRPEEALPYIEESVRLARDTDAVLDTHGWILILLGRHREGIGILARAIELNQSAAEYHLHAAEGYAREGTDMASAAKEFNRARKLAEEQGDENMVARVDQRARELKVDISVKSDDN